MIFCYLDAWSVGNSLSMVSPLFRCHVYKSNAFPVGVHHLSVTWRQMRGFCYFRRDTLIDSSVDQELDL